MLCSIVINEHHGVDRLSEPVTVGLPFPGGVLLAPDHVRLINDRREELPIQVEVLDRWVDGSVKSGLFDFQATVAAGSSVEYRLQHQGEAPPASEPGILLSTSPDLWQVDTGVCRFSLMPHLQAL